MTINKADECYLDNSTSTQPFSTAVDKLLPFCRSKAGYYLSPHRKGEELQAALSNSVQTLYNFLGANKEDHFQFLGSGIEAIHGLMFAFYRDVVRETGRNHFLCAHAEEAIIARSLQELEELSCWSEFVPLSSNGVIDLEKFSKMVKPRTAAVSISWVNGLTGVVQPIEEIAQICQQNEIYLHVDASHAIGKLAIDFKNLPVDFLTFEGKCIHAPCQAGAILSKKGSGLRSIIPGNPPLNIGALVGLAHACSQMEHYTDHLCMETARLRFHFEQRITSELEESVVFFSDSERVSNISALGFRGVVAEAVLYELNQMRVYATIGGNNFPRLTHTLECSQIDPELAAGALSFALSYQTTQDEIDHAVDCIVSSVKRLRKISHGCRDAL